MKMINSDNLDEVLSEWQKQMNSEKHYNIPPPPKSKVRAMMDIVSDFDFGNCEADIN